MKLPLKKFLKRVLRPHEVNAIVNLPKEVREGISLGDYTSYNFEALQRFMDLWCERLDSLIAIDKELNAGAPSWKSHYATTWRGFTYAEYNGLFNAHITVEEFPFYPVFTQLNKNKGGILNEKQRADFQARLVYDEENYIAALLLAKIEPLLTTLFNDIAQVSARLPLNKIKMHTYISASTGSGKSELMRIIFHQMVERYKDFSYVLIDPHGSLAESVKKLKSVSEHPERVVYIDPFLKDGFTPTFNPFQIKDTSIKNLTFAAEQIISAIEEVLSREGGVLTEVQMNTLEKCLYFLLQRGNSNILHLVELLQGKNDMLEEANAYDSDFFNEEFGRHTNRTRKALLDRVERLLNSPILKNLLGGTSTFDLEKILNTKGKILIINLADVGEQTQIAMGKFLIASIKSIVRKRKKNSGFHTFLMVDEAHTLVSGSFEFILNQLRGFGLHVLLANQYLNQLDKQAETVRQNTAIKIVASDDFEEMNKVAKVPKEVYLKDYEFFLKIRGYPVQVFKSPDYLLKNPTQYEISKAQEERIDDYQIKHYYRRYDKATKLSSKSKPPKDDFQKGTKRNPLTPPFGLKIDE